MGATHSSQYDRSGKKNATSLAISKPHIFCLPSLNLRLPGMLRKLRRSLTNRLRLRLRRRKGHNGSKSSARKLTRKTSSAALLRPMPRCSSFGSCGTLLTPTKLNKMSKADCRYAQWKCMFEDPDSSPAPLLMRRPHDISEALSGQTTPRGFPSHTDARQWQQQQNPAEPLYDFVGEIKVRRRLSFRLPKLNTEQGSMRRPTARQRAAQAQLEAQLKRDLCDLEEYYGGFYFTRQPGERMVLI
ncbi:protein nullo [Scaptodrosophila lebanonensis]|uniref:Protein nullo n=1 Tax=Drosophila lebanonensis TaxID=7225 RepID=A0A6J2U1W8_DROLE|nr:protein nullo [Scaptodrosophila lebanonensis]